MVDSFNNSLVFLAIQWYKLHMSKPKTKQPSAWFPPLIPSPWAQCGQTLKALRVFCFSDVWVKRTVWELVNMTTHELWFVSMVETLINLFLNDMYLLTLCPHQPLRVKTSWSVFVRYAAVGKWLPILMVYTASCCMFALRQNAVTQQFPWGLALRLRLSAHHFSNIIRGSRILLSLFWTITTECHNAMMIWWDWWDWWWWWWWWWCW